jgi:DNA-binding response OmpR family regulator
MEIKITGSRILAIGSILMARRLMAKTAGGQFVITGCSDPSEAAKRLADTEFDLVIIDNLVQDIAEVCRRAVEQVDVPVALFLQDKPVDWKRLLTLPVDGYLADGGTNAEFTARVQAFMRRKLMPCHCA